MLQKFVIIDIMELKIDKGLKKKTHLHVKPGFLWKQNINVMRIINMTKIKIATIVEPSF